MAAKSAKVDIRNPVREVHAYPMDGQVDILRMYDTRYPHLRSHRRLPGNGDHPENPYGGEMKTSPYPYTEIEGDDNSQPEKVKGGVVKSGKKASGGEY